MVAGASVIVHTVPGQTVDSLERNRNIRTGVGTDYCTDWTRLGLVHHNYRFAQVHEVGFEILSAPGT